MKELSDEEVAEIWSRFDHDGSGSINYEEFLKSLRPPLNNARYYNLIISLTTRLTNFPPG